MDIPPHSNLIYLSRLHSPPDSTPSRRTRQVHDPITGVLHPKPAIERYLRPPYGLWFSVVVNPVKMHSHLSPRPRPPSLTHIPPLPIAARLLSSS
jgi:hypothetical protein